MNMIEENQALISEKRERNYGIDLLRLVSMLMVVTLHVLGGGGILNNTQTLSLRSELFWTIEIFCYCAVNVYAIISGYVGLNAKHKFSSLINLCIQITFYSFAITGADLVMLLIKGEKISLFTTFTNLFPSMSFVYHGLWYFSAYFCLFFIMPILNSIVENVARNTLKIVAVFIFIVFCGWTQIYTDVIHLGRGYSVLWLAIMYVFGAYMAKYDILKNLSVANSVLGYLICVAVSVLSRFAMGSIFPKRINLLVSYTSPTIVLCAIFLINIFAKMRIGKKSAKTIAVFAPLSFGVYLIHCHPVIMNKLIDGSFSWVANAPLYLAFPLVVGIALAIFASCLIIDKARLVLFNICQVKSLSIWIERFVGKMFSKILKILHCSLE